MESFSSNNGTAHFEVGWRRFCSLVQASAAGAFRSEAESGDSSLLHVLNLAYDVRVKSDYIGFRER